MKKFLLLVVVSLFLQSVLAQTKVSGSVKDAATGETLPGAAVEYATGLAVITDIDGLFEFIVSPGTYFVSVRYVGYEEMIRELNVTSSNLSLDFLLESILLKEVQVIGDIALERKTPVAFSNISSIKIKEELGTQDMPMILNSTPGIHATQTGGGDGDSRVNIRGFNNRNVAVMVDGIPMNDMENGTVYWSNWFGLDVVTQRIQVQRGLGASKLAIPSVGGTINIMSEGIEEKRKVVIATEYGNNNNTRLTFGFNSGRFGKGWGVTSAISVKYNEGWVDQLTSKQLYYFLKIQKQYEKNSFSFTAMGSPQMHNQRIGRQLISYYDVDYALSQGADTTGYTTGDYGVRHNEYWGTLRRVRNNPDASEETISSRINYYHKPILNFKHLWTPGSKFALSNVLYASFGDGGGTASTSSPFTENGQTDFQKIYKDNITGSSIFGLYFPPNDTSLVKDTSKYKTENFIFSRVNNHVWYGLLSTFKYRLNERLELSGGIDARYYTTERYKQVYDLLGGDYAVPAALGDDFNNLKNVVKYEGDKYEYNIRSYVQQAGLFALGEYNIGGLSAFLNITGSISQYNRIDYYARKNEDGSFMSSGWKKFPAGTLKGGCSYSFNEQHNVFFNAGYISRAPMMSNTYVQTTLNTYINLKNEEVKAVEAGYMFNSKFIKPTVNFYYTRWNNRPVTGSTNTGTEILNYNVPGMNAQHIGGELEIESRINKTWVIEGAFSYGDWRWISDGTAIISNEDGTKIIDEIKFSAKGVLVGDAAQLQTSLGVRFSPIKGFYIKPRFTYFDKYYSDFDPDGLQGENANRQSWAIPAYYTLDVNFGYNLPIGQNNNRLGLKVNLINVTDNIYVSDARNNEFGNTFDATSAGVFMGMGFRWNIGLNYTF